MADVVINIEELSKKYTIGTAKSGSFRETFTQLFSKSEQKGQEEFWALHDLSFQIKHGEAVGIIGRNGAGKSTLLKVLSRITEPTKGRIELNGRISSLLEVGTGFHPELTGRENVYLNGTILGMTRREVKAKFDEIIDFSGVERFIDTPVKHYSSGMYVRLAFAVAAHLEPEILIVDEVLAVGDAEFQKKCLGKMGEVAGEGRTVLFVSHNMASIQNLCNTAIFLKKGCLVDKGNIVDVTNLYLSTSKSINQTSLLNRKDRKGSGDLIFTNIKVWNSKNSKQENVGITGSPFNIELQFKSLKAIENVIFSVGIFSATSKLFFSTLRSDCLGERFDVAKGEGSVIFSFERNPFTQGNYSMNLLAQTRFNKLDWIQDADTFEVSNGDFYGNGILPASGRQGLLIDFKINYEKNS